MVHDQEDLEVGEIGVFVVNGESYVKELGQGVLVSHNQKRPNIPLHEFDNIRCVGKVVGKMND